MIPEQFIAIAKDWLKEHLEDDDNYYNEEELCWIGRDEFLANFENDMTKLLEDEK